MSENTYTDLDSPWKDVLEVYFPEFIEFFFPHVYALIDWTQPYEFLDKEFQKIAQQALSGRKIVDKLIKVYQLDGQLTHIYVHIEVQMQYEKAFAERMFIYYYRIFDTFKQPIVSLAILGDVNPHWRPGDYQQHIGGCHLNFQFPSVKLLDYEADWETLSQVRNPFSLIVRTHLKMLATHNNPTQRLNWKIQLFRALYEEGYAKQDIIHLFRFLDWVMTLPESLAEQFDERVLTYSEEQQMPVLSHIERKAEERGRVQGREEGRLQGIKDLLVSNLQQKFTTVPTSLINQLAAINDIQQLMALSEIIFSAQNLAELHERIEQQLTQKTN